MNKVSRIYTLVDPRTDQVRYIGQSVNPKSRYSVHTARNTTTSDAVVEWVSELRALGKKPLLRIIDTCPIEIIDERENYWIRLHREYGFDLLNTKKVGRGIFKRHE